MKQREVFVKLCHFIQEEGYTPSYRQLMGILGFSSTSTIKGHLDNLKSKGYVTWEPGHPRTLKIISEETAS
ncbi:transcriptional regulator [Metabacillus litoralis]|nr:transcriptional regulator [Metabacillus litoralis]